LSVFRLDTASGRLSREGVFYISSNDYYSSTNYATRLIGDNLVIYTPFEVSRHGPPIFPLAGGPALAARRRAATPRAGGPAAVRRRRIYRPVRADEDPTVHTVSVCPLGPAGAPSATSNAAPPPSSAPTRRNGT
jgi:hypothetical protein